MRESGRYGVHAAGITVNFKEVADRRDEVIVRSREAVVELLRHHDVHIYQGEADVLAPGG